MSLDHAAAILSKLSFRTCAKSFILSTGAACEAVDKLLSVAFTGELLKGADDELNTPSASTGPSSSENV
jgi:hypothetical protein